jgi:hypothetical protein
MVMMTLLERETVKHAHVLRSTLRPRGAAVAAGSIALSLAMAPLGPGPAQAQAPATTLPAKPSTALALPSTASVLPAAQDNLSLAWAIPNYPVGRQLRWLLGAFTKASVPTAELKAHFDASFLAAAPPAVLNADLGALRFRAPLRVTYLDAGLTASALEGGLASGAAEYSFIMSVDSQGLISGLRLGRSPALPATPTSWAGLDAQLRSLAPGVGFLAATIAPPTARGKGSSCHVLNSLSATTARPLGSMFKLYVLSTVASEVRSGRLSWSKEVPLTAGLRSLPSGFLQIVPAGSTYTVSQLAQIMMPGSDNTAADRLMALAGRSAIEAQVATTSAHASLDDPFLRTRELFVLKYAGYPKYANAYLELLAPKRTAYLDNVVDRVPLSAVDLTAATGAPRDIGSIEWFASPSDICSLYSQLYAYASSPSLAPISSALSYNDGGIGLSRTTWPLVWFKGGSEQGVLTLGFLARRADGTVAVVTVLLSDPAKSIPAEVTLKALADAHAAFGLVPAS